MNSELISQVVSAYSFLENLNPLVSPLGEGLIHETLLISSEENQWVLQGFNESVFRYPERIDFNLSLLSTHAEEQNSTLPFLLPLPLLNKEGKGLTDISGKKYRLFSFVNGKTLQQIESIQEAYKAAQAYGEFASWAKAIDGESMQETIPDFHRLDLRFEKLKEVASTKSDLAPEESDILQFYFSQEPLIKWYVDQLAHLPLRVTHNDTKINNLIFSEDLNKVDALIDLDTLMGGFLIYDFGDLVRTVACSLLETSTQWKEIQLYPETFEELLKGYWEGVKDFASIEEARSLLLGGEIMTLIMGLRFFTDHLQGNIYYRVSYPEQNFDRAKNQMVFLQSQQRQRPYLRDIWSKVTGLDF